jgi:hypothetical protein
MKKIMVFLAFLFAFAAMPAMADTFMCPGGAVAGGDGTQVVTPTTGVAACGTLSGVNISIALNTEYGKLTFSSGSPSNYPNSLTLGNLAGLAASVIFTSGQPTQDGPYYELAFTDIGNTLGATTGDQILLLEYGVTSLPQGSLTNWDFNPATSVIDVFDNTTGVYLLGGQAVTTTLDGFLASNSEYDNQPIQQIRLAEGLAGGCTAPCTESLTVNSLDVTQTAVPEPGTLALLGLGLLALVMMRRKILGAARTSVIAA